LLEVDPDAEYEDSDDILGKSTLSDNEEEE
jgi:hypothetical protein